VCASICMLRSVLYTLQYIQMHVFMFHFSVNACMFAVMYLYDSYGNNLLSIFLRFLTILTFFLKIIRLYITIWTLELASFHRIVNYTHIYLYSYLSALQTFTSNVSVLLQICLNCIIFVFVIILFLLE